MIHGGFNLGDQNSVRSYQDTNPVVEDLSNKFQEVLARAYTSIQTTFGSASLKPHDQISDSFILEHLAKIQNVQGIEGLHSLYNQFEVHLALNQINLEEASPEIQSFVTLLSSAVACLEKDYNPKISTHDVIMTYINFLDSLFKGAFLQPVAQDLISPIMERISNIHQKDIINVGKIGEIPESLGRNVELLLESAALIKTIYHLQRDSTHLSHENQKELSKKVHVYTFVLDSTTNDLTLNLPQADLKVDLRKDLVDKINAAAGRLGQELGMTPDQGAFFFKKWIEVNKIVYQQNTEQ